MGRLIDRSSEASLMRTTLIAILIAVSFVGRALSPALAAPQMMGLVANNNAMPLQCQHGDCFAEFTAFCLQPEQVSPVQRTAYRLHDSALLVAVATTKDVREIKLEATAGPLGEFGYG